MIITRKSAFRLFPVELQRFLPLEEFYSICLQRSLKKRSNDCQINYLVSLIKQKMHHHPSLGDTTQTRRAFYGSLFPSGDKTAGLEIPSSSSLLFWR